MYTGNLGGDLAGGACEGAFCSTAGGHALFGADSVGGSVVGAAAENASSVAETTAVPNLDIRIAKCECM